jgi:UDP-N-acetylglucosamine transferase subunit ALG13
VIFLSVGTQLGFDRLVRSVDKWCSMNTEVKATAQIGAGDYVPKHMDWERNLEAEAYAAKVEMASTLIAHAGMGSLLTAIGAQKPLIMMPRDAQLGEHRNDHQLDAIDRVMRPMGVHVALDDLELHALLDCARELEPPHHERMEANRSGFITKLRGALFGEVQPSLYPPGANPGGVASP